MENMQIVLKRILQVMGVIGSNLYWQNCFSHVLKIKTFLSFTVLLSLTACQIFVEWKGVDTLSKIDFLPGIFLGFSEIIFLSLNMKPLKKLIDGFENFWPLDHFGPEIQQKMQAIFDKTYTMMKLYLVSCFLCGVLFAIAPFIANTKSVIFSIHEPCDVHAPLCYEILYTWQMFVLLLDMYPVIVGLDLLFLTLILHQYVGIELLKCGFRELDLVQRGGDAGKVKAHIREIVTQHNIILHSIREFNDLFSKLLLVKFGSVYISQILVLYMLTEEGIPPDSSRISRYGVIYVIYVFQLLIYSYGGMLLVEQTTSVADEAYAVDWCVRTQPSLRNSLAFIILRSHKPNKITIGNMADLNLVSFVQIIKNALSVYALLRQLQEEGK